ncbi:uncharacterized protein N0V89_000051 [Didymosphaeria variabile]|uniref:Uncharacterized protein n=1 Tax=Didymosphaeria variabile TaxID=1932322 RepID=A0A9W9CFG9_9PLEO|nr:uncharacterized protein N0V89_000051 [Didymosphaeria variabile]KAJ4359496.1 hypothetical protein N0V89_000051 [Didymosphaeria variabile]
MCCHFNSTFNTPGTCTLDLSYVDSAGILRLIDGVDSVGELCGVLKGTFGNEQCYVNLKDTTASGGGSEDVKKDACAKLKGTWDGGKCEVFGFAG